MPQEPNFTIPISQKIKSYHVEQEPASFKIFDKYLLKKF